MRPFERNRSTYAQRVIGCHDVQQIILQVSVVVADGILRQRLKCRHCSIRRYLLVGNLLSPTLEPFVAGCTNTSLAFRLRSSNVTNLQSEVAVTAVCRGQRYDERSRLYGVVWRRFTLVRVCFQREHTLFGELQYGALFFSVKVQPNETVVQSVRDVAVRRAHAHLDDFRALLRRNFSNLIEVVEHLRKRKTCCVSVQ